MANKNLLKVVPKMRKHFVVRLCKHMLGDEDMSDQQLALSSADRLNDTINDRLKSDRDLCRMLMALRLSQIQDMLMGVWDEEDSPDFDLTDYLS